MHSALDTEVERRTVERRSPCGGAGISFELNAPHAGHEQVQRRDRVLLRLRVEVDLRLDRGEVGAARVGALDSAEDIGSAWLGLEDRDLDPGP